MCVQIRSKTYPIFRGSRQVSQAPLERLRHEMTKRRVGQKPRDGSEIPNDMCGMDAYQFYKVAFGILNKGLIGALHKIVEVT